MIADESPSTTNKYKQTVLATTKIKTKLAMKQKHRRKRKETSANILISSS